MSSKSAPLVVEVRLYGALRRYRPAGKPGAPHHPFALQLDGGATVDQARLRLGIPDGMVNAAAVDDEAVPLAHVLRGGNRLALFPQTAGGGRLETGRQLAAPQPNYWSTPVGGPPPCDRVLAFSCSC